MPLTAFSAALQQDFSFVHKVQVQDVFDTEFFYVMISFNMLQVTDIAKVPRWKPTPKTRQAQARTSNATVQTKPKPEPLFPDSDDELFNSPVQPPVKSSLFDDDELLFTETGEEDTKPT